MLDIFLQLFLALAEWAAKFFGIQLAAAQPLVFIGLVGVIGLIIWWLDR